MERLIYLIYLKEQYQRRLSDTVSAENSVKSLKQLGDVSVFKYMTKPERLSYIISDQLELLTLVLWFLHLRS